MCLWLFHVCPSETTSSVKTKTANSPHSSPNTYCRQKHIFRADSIVGQEVSWGELKVTSGQRGYLPQQPLNKSKDAGEKLQSSGHSIVLIGKKSTWTKNGNMSTTSEPGRQVVKKTNFTYCHLSRQQIHSHSVFLGFPAKREQSVVKVDLERKKAS